MLRLPKTEITRLGTGTQCIFKKSIDYALPRRGYYFRSVFAFICPILYPWLCSVAIVHHQGDWSLSPCSTSTSSEHCVTLAVSPWIEPHDLFYRSISGWGQHIGARLWACWGDWSGILLGTGKESCLPKLDLHRTRFPSRIDMYIL
jgi:hypothetical protein